MIRKDITQKQLLDAVCSYEKKNGNAQLLGVTDVDSHIYRFKALRREKIVIVLLGGLFSAQQEKILQLASDIVMTDTSLSDNMDFYTTGIITDNKAAELELPLRKHGITISFFDSKKMENVEEFKSLFEEESEKEVDDNEIDPAFFDYLAMSNDSSDIKSGFFYSLLLMEIYRHEPITENEFYEICQPKYGRSKADLSIALKSLRKNGKITPLKKGGVFSLTDEEERVLEKAVKESKSEEIEFKDALKLITEKYNLNGEKVFEKLKTDYLSKYTVFALMDDSGNGTEKNVSSEGEAWSTVLKGIDEQKSQAFMEELKQLCSANDYLDQYGLAHSFLNLFRSDRYEGYIKQKECCLFLDTLVIAYYICAHSTFQTEYDIVWDNTEFTSANDLFGYSNESKEKIKFFIPHDYLQETIGEYKKALQLTWFGQFSNIPIPVETANVFYNYYQVVKNNKQHNGEDVSSFTFISFAKQMGFPETNPDSMYFYKNNIGFLRYFLNHLGCETLDMVEVNRSIFDIVKTDYVWYLHERNRDKSEPAINADIRQSLYITEKSQESNANEQEYYFVSWDNTLYYLRDTVKREKEIAGRSYNVFKPGELAEKLAFRSFRFNKESVSNEIFTYANNSFNVNEKIRSLYDNVLNPYFASFDKSNPTLVLEVLKLQKASMERPTEGTHQNEKTALENIFLSIITELPRHNCSTQNLKDFLNDKDNNTQIIPLFKQAFESYHKGDKINIANKVCDMVKAYVSKDEKEIVI